MKYLVTSALPYANGPIHFGHVAGAYLPADVFVRFKRQRREQALFICGTDEHGTPITVNAEKEGLPPKAYTDKWHEVIKRAFDRLDIRFDNFSRTTKPHHYELTKKFFLTLQKNGYVFSQVGPELYCEKDRRGLPDRYVQGTCYVCGHDPARGDECPKCGSALDALQLKNPRCRTCGTPATIRQTPNWYVDIPKLRSKLAPHIEDADRRWKKNVMGEVHKYWDDLRTWVITRSLDWGVPVPLDTPDAVGKVFYVWFDAPIGYVSSTIEWAEREGKPDAWKDWWFGKDTRLIHFIGKDNIAFHTVRWPAMLLGQDDPYPFPYDVPANEFYNLEGGKFSTSDGWYVDFDQFLDTYPADTLRWTIARTAPETRDSEFTWKDFQSKVNAELLGNFGNFASRVLKFTREKLGGKIPRVEAPLGDPENQAIAKAHAAFDEVAKALDVYGVRVAAEKVLELGYAANKLLEQREPWKTLKSDPPRCATTLNVAARLLELLTVALYPFVPGTAEKLWAQLGLPGSVTDRAWNEAKEAPAPGGRAVGTVDHLFKRIEDSQIEAEVQALRARAAARQEKPKVEEKKPDVSGGATPANAPPKAATPATPEGPKPDVSYDDFAKLDIKVAKVLACEPVQGADKLYKLELEIEGGQKRTVVSGIRPWYKPEDVIGNEVVYFANLAPKKLRGVMSHGMILAAHSNDGGAVLLRPEKATFPGSKVS